MLVVISHVMSCDAQVDHFSKYKLQENTSDDEGDQQQKQQIQQLPLETNNTTATKVSGLYLETQALQKCF